MAAGVVALDPSQDAHFAGSDGLLELTIPAGAVSPADITAAGGKMSLLIRQVAPASGGSAGGWGRFSFGTYAVQVLDARGQLAKSGLRKPIQATLHAGKEAGAVDLAHVVTVVNGALPANADLTPSAASAQLPGTPSNAASASRQASPRPAAANQPASVAASPNSAAAAATLGKFSQQRAQLDSTTRTLSASITAGTATTSVSWDTNAPVASFGRPDPFETNLSGGALTAGFPVDVPAGPGGLTPPLTLSYDSASLNEQHNPQAAAPWVGEGWNLSLGSISWSEHAVNLNCGVGLGPCGGYWENTWQLSDPFGTSGDLIPPNQNVSTYYGDLNGSTITASPLSWHTSPESHIKVISYQGPNSLPGMSAIPPCFRAFLPSGVMEEFGCTPDSLQYYPQPSGSQAGLDYIANWLLDLITDPSGNQIHVTYQTDIASGYNNVSYPRDAQLATVEYDSPGCHNVQVACTGGAWAPLVRVSFQASHTVAHVRGSSCAANGNLRCDDPVDLSGSSGVAAPTVQSTWVLNDILVQVRGTASAGWNTLRTYRLSYDQSGPTTITDPVSGTPESTAGKLTLTQLQELGSDGSTAMPARLFGYTVETQYYEDSNYQTTPTTNCGPSFTIRSDGKCMLWSRSYDGSSYYLTSVANGLGMTQTFTWQIAHSSNTLDPFYCDTHTCSFPDNQAWSRIILFQRTNTTLRTSQAGSGGTPQSTAVASTTSYAYQQFSYEACCPGSYYGSWWGDLTDADWMDFYNYRFMGFSQVNVSNPDGSTETHQFAGSAGAGVADTSWSWCTDPNSGTNYCIYSDNPWYSIFVTPYSGAALHGHEREVDRYGTDGHTLLQKTLTTFNPACQALSAELDTYNPVQVCDLQKISTEDLTYDGTTGAAVDKVTVYQYDSMGRPITITAGARAAVADVSGHNNTATASQDAFQGAPGILPGNPAPATGLLGLTGAVTGPGVTALQGDNARTLETWLQTSDTRTQAVLTAGNGGLLSVYDPNKSGAFTIWIGSPSHLFPNPPSSSPGVFIRFGFDYMFVPGNLADGRPHHLVVTLSGSNVWVYLDTATPSGYVYNGAPPCCQNPYWSGLTAQPLTVPRTPNTVSGPLYVGTSYQYASPGAWSGPVFNGKLAQVAVYDHIVPSNHITVHYQGGTNYRNNVLIDSPVSYYPMDDIGAKAPSLTVHQRNYIWNDAVTTSSTSATGTYITDRVAFEDTEDWSGSRYQCTYTTYDTYASNGWMTGSTTNLTLGRKTMQTKYTSCGNSGNNFQPSGGITTSYAYDGSGNVIAGDDPDANAGVSAHTGCYLGTFGPLSNCTTYDNTFGVLPTAQTNALNQVTTTGYQAPGSGTVTDISGNGNHGVTNGPLALGVAGVPALDGGTAMGFNNQGYGAIPDSSRWHSSAVSVEAWVYKTADVDWQRVIGGGSFPNSNFQLAADNTGKLQFLVFINSTNTVGAATPSAIPLSTWSHVVGTFDGTTIALYLNGALVDQHSVNVTMATGSGGLGIGADANGGNPWNGRLQEVAVYNSAISASRVQAHFNAGSNYRRQVLSDSPATYYRLADVSGPASGFGLWPASSTDASGQTTWITYDVLGRQTGEIAAGETSGLTTVATAYTVWCSGTAAQAPCVEIDKTQRLNSTTTVTSRAFYDGMGHLVETRSPAPGGQDVIQYMFYDQSQRLAFKSIPYLVSAYNGGPGSGAFSTPDSNQPGTTYTYDGLGRQLSVSDALSHKTTTGFSVVCAPAGTGDSSCLEQTLTADPNSHQGGKLTDALGRTAYVQRYSGNSSSTYAVYATASYGYDYLGNVLSILQPDGASTQRFGYDMAGRRTSVTDPDLGTLTYNYDPDGNLIQSTDARGSGGTVFTGYDGLDRPIWRNTTNSSSGAYMTYGYDSTASGNMGAGRLTSETFASGSLSGSYTYAYDGRGQKTASTLTVGSSSYPLQTSYDDAGNALTETYPTGETVTNTYSAQGWLTGVSTRQGSVTTALLASASYSGIGGAFGEMTGASLGNGTYSYSASYDQLGRPGDISWTHAGTTLFEQRRNFDAAGQLGLVSSINTTLPAGTDNQAFCYDEQDRVTWAGSTGTQPCTNTAVSPGTLSAAQYTQSFTYDNLGRLRTGPQGSYTYGDGAHLHAATALASGASASYDASGNMICRAPTSATTCSGTPTGAQLSYGPEGTMTGWQDKPSSPSMTAAYLYDPQGQRVVQQVTQSGLTTTIVYAGDVEQVATTGGTSTTTTFYYASGQRIALAVNGAISYLASEALGSPSVALSGSGTATASQLFAPYGGTRYSSSTMPADFGFTGQHQDAASGLSYFNSRYYDPAMGQFTSADGMLVGKGTNLWGLSRFAYTGGNPISRTDLSGHDWFDEFGNFWSDFNAAIDNFEAGIGDFFSGISDAFSSLSFNIGFDPTTGLGALTLSTATDSTFAGIGLFGFTSGGDTTIGTLDFFNAGTDLSLSGSVLGTTYNSPPPDLSTPGGVVAAAVNGVNAYSGWISTGAGVLAAGTAEVPEVSAPAGVVSVITGGLAANKDIKDQQYLAAVFDVAGAVTGTGGLVELKYADWLGETADGMELSNAGAWQRSDALNAMTLDATARSARWGNYSDLLGYQAALEATGAVCAAECGQAP